MIPITTKIKQPKKMYSTRLTFFYVALLIIKIIIILRVFHKKIRFFLLFQWAHILRAFFLSNNVSLKQYKLIL